MKHEDIRWNRINGEWFCAKCGRVSSHMVVPILTKAGCEVVIEAGAGEEAGYPDSHYVQKGAKIIPERAAVFESADIIVQVLCYGSNDITGKADLPLLRRDQVLIGFLRP